MVGWYRALHSSWLRGVFLWKKGEDMETKNTYTEEYQSLRTRLFNLELRLAMEARTLSNVEYEDLKKEIYDIKKEMGSLLYSTMEERNANVGGIKK